MSPLDLASIDGLIQCLPWWCKSLFVQEDKDGNMTNNTEIYWKNTGASKWPNLEHQSIKIIKIIMNYKIPKESNNPQAHNKWMLYPPAALKLQFSSGPALQCWLCPLCYYISCASPLTSHRHVTLPWLGNRAELSRGLYLSLPQRQQALQAWVWDLGLKVWTLGTQSCHNLRA